MRNDTRTAEEAAATRRFTRSVDGVTATQAGKQLVIKDGTRCKDVSVPLDRPVGGEGEVLESGIHLGGAALSVGENDVSATVDCGVQLGHVENRRFFMPADHPSISKNTPPLSRFVVSLVTKRPNSKRGGKKNHTQMSITARVPCCINNTHYYYVPTQQNGVYYNPGMHFCILLFTSCSCRYWFFTKLHLYSTLIIYVQ